MNVALLCCGPTGLLGLQTVCSQIKPVLVATSESSVEVRDYCHLQNIPVFIGKPRNSRLFQFIVERNLTAELLISINYIFVVEKDVLSMFRWCVNLHGSLLPRYRGRSPNVWAIINNESTTGVTAHFMTEKCDAGDIVDQTLVRIAPEDTGGRLVEKLVAQYPDIIKRLITKAKGGNLSGTPQNETLATYFGKRTPEHGRINWSWSRERIVNWVRAQSSPYPGAFSELNERKIIIDRVSPVEWGYHYETQNGTILRAGSRIIIKAGTGPLELISIRSPLLIELEEGAVLT